MKKLHPKIHGVMRTNSMEELAEYYSMADVYVNTTLEDTFPTTNLEALACGTPVITFATGGSVESVDDSTGKIVPKGDTEALIRAIEELRAETDYVSGSSGGEKASEIREACLKKSKEYDKNDRFRDYIQLYRELLEEQHE
jgi:glycosyltransferase involved in cell wall biosynthesis